MAILPTTTLGPYVKQLKIRLFFSYTTHLTQPLDKMFWATKIKMVHKYMAKNPGKVVNRFVFSQLLHEAWTDAMTSLNIKAGFRTT